jgi:hypothetical protein
MIDDTDDVRWVKAQRPAIEPPDAEATGWARAALLAHAERSSRLTCLDSPPERPAARATRCRKSGLFGSHRGMAAAAAIALMAAAGIAASLIGFPNTGGKGLSVGVDQAAAKTLQKLAMLTLDAQPQKGDATLILRTHDFSNDSSFTGADLYLDDGRYFYAMTPEGLPAAVKGGPVDYSVKPMLDAMAAVATADPNVARAAFLKAVNPQWGDDTENEARARQDNAIWCTGLDVLGAAYGRPNVRAGMLRVLSTVDGVTVKHTTYEGKSALEIAMYVPKEVFTKADTSPTTIRSTGNKAVDAQLLAKMQARAKAIAEGTIKPIPAHFMTMTVDDSNGALLLYTDVGLKVTYHVTRVDAAAYGL